MKTTKLEAIYIEPELKEFIVRNKGKMKAGDFLFELLKDSQKFQTLWEIYKKQKEIEEKTLNELNSKINQILSLIHI